MPMYTFQLLIGGPRRWGAASRGGLRHEGPLAPLGGVAAWAKVDGEEFRSIEVEVEESSMSRGVFPIHRADNEKN